MANKLTYHDYLQRWDDSVNEMIVEHAKNPNCSIEKINELINNFDFKRLILLNKLNSYYLDKKYKFKFGWEKMN